MSEVTLVDAIDLALARAMEDDPPWSCLAKMSASMAAFSVRPPGSSAFRSERVLDTPLPNS